MAKIDELMAEAAKKPARKIPPRKGNDPNKATAKPVAKRSRPDLPEILDDSTRAYQVAALLRDGYTIKEVCDELNLSEVSAKEIIAQGMARAHDMAADIFMNWFSLELLRTNRLMRQISKKLFDEDDNMNVAAMEQYRAEREFMRRVIDMMTKSARNSDDSNKFKETMPRNSPLYEEANASIGARIREGAEPDRPSEIAGLDNLLTDGIVYQYDDSK